MTRRVAFIVSHPVQYYTPLYQRLACREDLQIKIFFTWHAGSTPVEDRGFGIPVFWDIPLTAGYDFELVENEAADPGTHHFFGLRNSSLVKRVTTWRPDIVIVHGWAWQSHLHALWTFQRINLPTLFRGDSNLLNVVRSGLSWWVKQRVLSRIFSWPVGFLVVGSANLDYYRAFGVNADRLFYCPHSIDVNRFANPAEQMEQEAAGWRHALGINNRATVLLYAGKFEPVKRPLELMKAVLQINQSDLILVLVGGGELQSDVNAIAQANEKSFRVLPFQNQSKMPLVYRLGDLTVLPSAHETWGLAVNEALASGRPVLISDRVGCAPDVVDGSCGSVFSWDTPFSLLHTLAKLVSEPGRLTEMRQAAGTRARNFDIGRTEEGLMRALKAVHLQ